MLIFNTKEGHYIKRNNVKCVRKLQWPLILSFIYTKQKENQKPTKQKPQQNFTHPHSLLTLEIKKHIIKWYVSQKINWMEMEGENPWNWMLTIMLHIKNVGYLLRLKTKICWILMSKVNQLRKWKKEKQNKPKERNRQLK